MNHNRKLIFKYIWVLTNASGLLVFALIPERLSFDMLAGVVFWLFLLALPGSMLFTLLFLFVVSCLPFNFAGIWMYLMLVAGLLTTGYLQWFHLVPHLFGAQQVTTLGLSEIKVVRSTHQTSSRARRRDARTKLSGAPTQAFDQLGRTPLERVISEN